MTRPMLSVVVCNYNHARWLPRSLSALLRQTRLPDEIVVVDDGSTDDSVAVIERFARLSDRIRLVRHPRNVGLVSSINEGLSFVRGDHVYFAAADDVVLPGLLETGLAGLRDHPEAAFACGNVARIHDDGRLDGVRPFSPPLARRAALTPAEVRRRIRSSDNWFVGHSVVFRTAPLREVGGFDPALGPLCDSLTARLLAFRHGFVFDPAINACWMVYPESFSARSVLSGPERDRLIAVGRAWIRERFPADVRDSYADLFERRYRFNIARLVLVWEGARAEPAAAIRETLELGPGLEPLIRGALALGRPGRALILAAAAAKYRPFGTGAMLRGFLNQRTLAARAAEIERVLAQAPLTGPPLAEPPLAEGEHPGLDAYAPVRGAAGSRRAG